MQRLNRTNKVATKYTTRKVMVFGGGNFNRAFGCWMIDLLNEKTDFEGGIILVKPTPGRDYTALREQDGLYHVVLNGVAGGQLVNETKLVSVIDQIVHPYLDWDQYLATAEEDSLRYIISNTTESGIQFESKDQPSDTPPSSFPAKVSLWLHHRFKHFSGAPDKGCVFLPCELIADNGNSLKDCILRYAELWNLSADFQDWVSAHCVFCNTLVDRIVTGYPSDNIDKIQSEIGLEDQMLVVGEPYHSWIIQGPQQLAEELPFDKIGLAVKWVDQLEDYRAQKVKILNGAHTSMVPIGYLAGKVSVKAAIETTEIGQFIEGLLQEEVWPTLDFSTEELQDFTSKTLDRFRNPFLFHKLLDIALNSISKFKTRLLPSLLGFVEKKGYCPPKISLALAALIVMYKGEWQGEKTPLRDNAEVLTFFQSLWANSTDLSQLVQQVLAQTQFWDQDLNAIPGLTKLVATYIQEIQAKGMVATLATVLSSTKS